MKKKSTGLLFITPFILFFMLFWLIPFIYGIVMSLSKYNVEMPIVEEAYNILYNGRNAREAVLLLMTREKREEK